MAEPTVKDLRTKMGMNQPEFANYFKVNLRTLQGWEQGKRMQEGMLSMMQRIIALEKELEETQHKLRTAETRAKTSPSTK